MNWYLLYRFAFRNKNDLLSMRVCGEIFSIVKGNIGKEVSKTINIEDGFNLFLYVIFSEEDLLKHGNFDIRANTNSFKQDLFPKFIRVELYLNKSFSKNDFDKLNYSLYDAVRHEIEHFRQNNAESEFDRSENIIENFRNFERYILAPNEIEAYIRGLVFSAKKQKAHFNLVLDNSLMELLFMGDLDIKKGILNSSIGNEVNEIMLSIRSCVMNRAKQIFPNLKDVPL